MATTISSSKISIIPCRAAILHKASASSRGADDPRFVAVREGVDHQHSWPAPACLIAVRWFHSRPRGSTFLPLEAPISSTCKNATLRALLPAASGKQKRRHHDALAHLRPLDTGVFGAASSRKTSRTRRPRHSQAAVSERRATKNCLPQPPERPESGASRSPRNQAIRN